MSNSTESRLQRCFSQLAGKKQAALIPYISAGDPNLDATVDLMHLLVESGADIIELGVPFSDPMADGPVIQKACERALAAGITLSATLDMVAKFRQDNTETPVVLMGYLNPVEAMGYQQFAEAAKSAGVDAVLTVDLIVEEAEEFCSIMKNAGLDPIFLAAPTTSHERAAQMSEMGGGYLYYVSLKGVTGAKSLDIDEVSTKLDELRSVVDLPIAVGFGIRDGASAAAVSAVADAVIVGSAIVQNIEDQQNDLPEMHRRVRALMQELNDALI